MLMKFAVISLFPEVFQSYLNTGVVGRALTNNLAHIDYYNPRDYSNCKHGTVDDKPFGGGPGMVLKPEPLDKAICDAQAKLLGKPKLIYLTPQGKPFTQEDAISHAAEKEPLILLSGRYEGIDERIVTKYVDYEYSIGDYVLTGGELPALVILDSIIRLIPGVLGDDKSNVYESFSDEFTGCLGYPQYTRPSEYLGMTVPAVLSSGNHEEIAKWRRKQSLGRTWLRRPNLLKCASLTKKDQQLLEEFKQEFLGV